MISAGSLRNVGSRPHSASACPSADAAAAAAVSSCTHLAGPFHDALDGPFHEHALDGPFHEHAFDDSFHDAFDAVPHRGGQATPLARFNLGDIEEESKRRAPPPEDLPHPSFHAPMDN